jgi:hypothetical protein
VGRGLSSSSRSREPGSVRRSGGACWGRRDSRYLRDLTSFRR